MTDQDWKTGGLDREKYVIRKPCPMCEGKRTIAGRTCYQCSGQGTVPPADPEAQYFVLRIDCGPNGPHDPHARAALYDYAKYVSKDNQKFADEIRAWLDDNS